MAIHSLKAVSSFLPAKNRELVRIAQRDQVRQTECRCSIAYAGDATPDNFVDLIGSVSDEHVCKKMCIADNQCDMYTYYTDEDPVQPRTCLLMTPAGS